MAKATRKDYQIYIGSASLLITIISLGIGISVNNLKLSNASKAAFIQPVTSPARQNILPVIRPTTSTVAPNPITIINSTLPAGTTNAVYNTTLVVSTPNDTTVTLTATKLPQNLKFLACTKVSTSSRIKGNRHICRLTGTISEPPGTYPFTLTATDSLGNQVIKDFILQVNRAGLH